MNIQRAFVTALVLTTLSMPGATANAAQATQSKAAASQPAKDDKKAAAAAQASDIAAAVKVTAAKDCGCGACAAKGCNPCKGKNCYFCVAKALATKECGCGMCDAKGCVKCGPGCDVCKFHLGAVAEGKAQQAAKKK